MIQNYKDTKMKKITLLLFIFICTLSTYSQEFDGVALGKPIKITLEEFKAKGYYNEELLKPEIKEYIINDNNDIDTIINNDPQYPSMSCCNRARILDTAWTYALDGTFNNQKVFLYLEYSAHYRTVYRISISFKTQPNWQLLEQQYNSYLSKLINKYGTPSTNSKDFSFYYKMHGGGDKYKAVKNRYCEYYATWASGVSIAIFPDASVSIEYDYNEKFLKTIQDKYNRDLIDEQVKELNEYKRQKFEAKRIKDSIVSVKDSLHSIECINPFESFIQKIAYRDSYHFRIEGIEIKKGCNLPRTWGIIFDTTENINLNGSFVMNFSDPTEGSFVWGLSSISITNSNNRDTLKRGNINTSFFKLRTDHKPTSSYLDAPLQIDLGLNLDINKEYYFKLFYVNDKGEYIFSNAVSYNFTYKRVIIDK